MTYFNASDVDSYCFRCLTKDDGKICKKCMELFAKKTAPGRFLDNTVELDPNFVELWNRGENKK